MSRTIVRYVGMVLIVGGVILSTTGIGAFSTVTADRQMFVGVGGKSTSYLGISTGEPTVTTNATDGTQEAVSKWQGSRYQRGTQAGTKVVLGTVTNYFPTALDSIEIIVSKTSGPVTVNEVYVENGALPLKPGEKPANLIAIVDCGGVSRGTGAATLKFEAKGTDTYATATRKVPVTCVNGTSSNQPASSNAPRLLPSPQRTSSGSR